ncbi:putative tetratricopeptide-like helical domain superfamily [Helianthus annuus]|nr:putative tetratricopeptide-like helical domain superfamily [Helianthus annuus]
MAVIGNLALLIDVTSPRATVIDRSKARLQPSDLFLNLFKKDLASPTSNLLYASLPSLKGGIEFEKDATTAPPHRGVRGRKANSKFNEVDYESSSDEDNGNGYGDEDEAERVESERRKRMEWENEMRMRVKEIEDMRELEKKAEELQSRGEGDDEGGNGDEDEDEGEESEETEEQKRERVRRELEKVAQEQAERRKMAQLMFDMGQRAYGKGMYGRSIEYLEGALTIIPRPTLFGGEIQIWLAMAYEANNRHKDCIDLYRKLETSHPIISIRRQAKDLRYILQAPKLKISQEEMVTIPLIGSSYDSYAGTWSDKNKDKDDKMNRSTTNQMSSGRDYLGDFLVWRPPGDLAKNQAFWAALVVWVALVGAALFLQ